MIFFDGLNWVENIMRAAPRNIFQEKGSSFFHGGEAKEQERWESGVGTHEEVMISCGLSMAEEEDDFCSTFQEIGSANASEAQTPFSITLPEESGLSNFTFFQKKESFVVDAPFLEPKPNNSGRFFSKTNKLPKRKTPSPEVSNHSEKLTSGEGSTQTVSLLQQNSKDDQKSNDFFSIFSNSHLPSQDLQKALFSIFQRAGSQVEESSRQSLLSRFLYKKKSRSFGIKYKSRQRVALSRQRLKGRFTTSLSSRTDQGASVLNSEIA